MVEGVLKGIQFPRHDALAREQRSSHFSESKPEREARSREEGRAAENSGENACELGIGDGVRRDGVHGATKIFVGDSVTDQQRNITKCDPAHPLAAIAEASAHTKPKWHKHLVKRATLRGENDAEAKDYGANGFVLGDGGFFFPVAAKLREKIDGGRAHFCENFVVAIPIVADCGCGDEDARLVFQLRQRGDEMTGGVDPAAAENLLAGGCPASAGNGSAGEVHYGVSAL